MGRFGEQEAARYGVAVDRALEHGKHPRCELDLVDNGEFSGAVHER